MAADQVAHPEWTDYRDKSGLEPRFFSEQSKCRAGLL
ncbi:MAG: hypothetical protein QOD94_1100 [Alphaproteobacteria bacterium]|jgi:hypothetical protein|nr:hypothetical protein [Alphaproteobacteria bacterium]